MPAFGLHLTPPWLLAMVGSALLHAWAVGSALRSTHPHLPRPAGTPAMAVRWLPPTDTPTSGAVARPSPFRATPKPGARQVEPKQARRAPLAQHPPLPALRPGAEPPTEVALASKLTPTSPSVTATLPPSPQRQAPATADLFSPLTTRPLGQGGWGRQRHAAANTETLATQAQQPWALQASLQSRLTAMAEVVRQGQPAFECEIRVDTFTRQAQVRCDPAVLHSAAWQALQGLALPGDASALTETTVCLQWRANQVLWAPCVPEASDAPGDTTPAASVTAQ